MRVRESKKERGEEEGRGGKEEEIFHVFPPKNLIYNKMTHFKRNEKRMKRLIIVGIIGLVNVQKKKPSFLFKWAILLYIIISLSR